MDIEAAKWGVVDGREFAGKGLLKGMKGMHWWGSRAALFHALRYPQDVRDSRLVDGWPCFFVGVYSLLPCDDVARLSILNSRWCMDGELKQETRSGYLIVLYRLIFVIICGRRTGSKFSGRA